MQSARSARRKMARARLYCRFQDNVQKPDGKRNGQKGICILSYEESAVCAIDWCLMGGPRAGLNSFNIDLVLLFLSYCWVLSLCRFC